MKTIAPVTAASALLTIGLALALHAIPTLSEETPANSPADPHAAAALEIVKAFSMQLKGELKAALKEGGPVKAIDVCQERAPAIAAEHAEQTGWEIGRTSLKPRHAELNAPDTWEQGVLMSFAQRQAAGEDVQTMVYTEVVATDDGKRFRFMKAIPTGEVCLACHGEAIAPEVAAALDQHYPNDQARGYRQGDLRGAFSLSKPL